MADSTDNTQELRHRTVQSSEDKKSSNGETAASDDRVESVGRKKPAVQKNTRKRKPSTLGRLLYKWLIKPAFVLLMLLTVIIVIALLILYCIDSKIEAVAFDLPPPPAFEGPLAPNTLLQQGKRILEDKIIGPESLAYYKGHIYTGSYTGEILRISTDDYKVRRLARLGKRPCGLPAHEPKCGRPLGMHIDNGHIYVMDAYLGLFEVEDGTGKTTELANNKRTYDAREVGFANDLTKFSRKDGDFFLTDSSWKWQRRQFPYAILESGECGRLIWYNPVSKRSNTAIPKLHFPNGITMSPKDDFVLIAETSRFRIMRYFVDGPRTGEIEVFADNLPGFPDNIRPSSTGGYWVGLAYVGARLGSFPLFDFLAPRPWLRNAITKVMDPSTLFSFFPKYGMIIELDQDGNIVRSLHDPTGEVVSSVSEVLDTGDALYLGSFHAPYMVKVDMDNRTGKT